MAARVDDDVIKAIKRVRDDKDSADWALAGFEGKDGIKLLGVGDGGVEALKKCLISGDVCYGLLRTSHEWESVGTIKAMRAMFIWLYYRPEGLPVSRKMKLGVFEGQLKKIFAPYHVDMNPSEPSELSLDTIKQLLDDVTMKADKTGNQAATGAALGARSTVAVVDRRERAGFLPTGTAADTANKGVKGAEVTFDDVKLLEHELNRVRSDDDDTTWCLFGYSNSKTLSHVASGVGGIEEMLSKAQDGTVNYGLYRASEKSSTNLIIRFCFVQWQPEEVPPMMKCCLCPDEKERLYVWNDVDRGLISTHKGAVSSAFREHLPWHFESRVTNRGDLTDDILKEKIGVMTGTKSMVVNGHRAVEAPQQPPERKFLGGVTNKTAKLSFVGEEMLRKAVDRVHCDSDPADFCLACFKEGGKLGLQDVGEGGLAALVACAGRGGAQSRCLFQVTKFCFIKLLGPDTPGKGKLGILGGAVSAVFEPFHGDLIVENEVDLTEVAMASATKKR